MVDALIVGILHKFVETKSGRNINGNENLAIDDSLHHE